MSQRNDPIPAARTAAQALDPLLDLHPAARVRSWTRPAISRVSMGTGFNNIAFNSLLKKINNPAVLETRLKERLAFLDAEIARFDKVPADEVGPDMTVPAVNEQVEADGTAAEQPEDAAGSATAEGSGPVSDPLLEREGVDDIKHLDDASVVPATLDDEDTTEGAEEDDAGEDYVLEVKP
ncbi:hypothetical protein AURDEDRAFT_130203 [Auricularia subglabra TFB-10046 SS5]|nr:hypothetical protein AURDEDRAFT_130203 [Auricularia subglabra TFB-10046 SS5]